MESLHRDMHSEAATFTGWKACTETCILKQLPLLIDQFLQESPDAVVMNDHIKLMVQF